MTLEEVQGPGEPTIDDFQRAQDPQAADCYRSYGMLCRARYAGGILRSPQKLGVVCMVSPSEK